MKRKNTEQQRECSPPPKRRTPLTDEERKRLELRYLAGAAFARILASPSAGEVEATRVPRQVYVALSDHGDTRNKAAYSASDVDPFFKVSPDRRIIDAVLALLSSAPPAYGSVNHSVLAARGLVGSWDLASLPSELSTRCLAALVRFDDLEPRKLFSLVDAGVEFPVSLVLAAAPVGSTVRLLLLNPTRLREHMRDVTMLIEDCQFPHAVAALTGEYLYTDYATLCRD